MTAVSDPPAVEPVTVPEVTSPTRGSRWRGILAGTAVCVLVGLLAQVPVLYNRVFYFWDDSSAQFVPMWRALGQGILSGGWPPMLDLDAWMGGNLAGEAMFGTWNPVNAANYVLAAKIDDLAVTATVVKTEFLVLLALGVYLLCREYGAARWASSVVAVALPFSGFTLYFEAATWAAGLMSFAWVPWVWWAARRMARNRSFTLLPFALGALAITVGNPYGLLGVCVVLLALMIEFAVRRHWRAVTRLFVLGLTLGGVALLVFLPLMGNVAVSWRTESRIFNDDFLRPDLSDLLGMSVPGTAAQIRSWAGGAVRMETPAMYFAWFALPILAWVDWKAVRCRAKALVSPLVVTVVYLMCTLGPSELWMFRWPLRLIEYVYLPLAVLLAVLLGSGLRTDHLRRRIAACGAIVLGGTYLSIAAGPDRVLRYVLGAAIVVVLLAAAVLLSRRGGRPTAVALHLGTAVVLFLQLHWFPGNLSVAQFGFPTSVTQLQQDFARRYQGTVFQVADVSAAVSTDKERSWRYVLLGNMYRAAGVASTTSYTGMGNKTFSATLCMNHLGSTCPEAYQVMSRPTELGPSLFDLMRVETIVVQRALVDDPKPPAGFMVTERNDLVTVLHRTAPLPWPEGRLSQASPNLRVTADARDHQRAEVLQIERSGPGRGTLAFARLAWPGYRAEIAGRELPVRSGPAGLLVVDVPPDVAGGEVRLRWIPPGLGVGLLALGVSALVAAGVSAFQLRARRHGTRIEEEK
ncbi:hypothetical protein GCM10012275_18570 [Longimycelium tulufanense]|uniref:YfhO family protein n=1 Tax=Longimycelium tulufanense TaxID=907463 RepID=A0A8J3FTP4_9PSEU|nr:hypothetical protein [Longimycelium tulufanense]GGM47797.1 hypothetical protein GCM10012275_18570 [Longimycelium tulufanense]